MLRKFWEFEVEDDPKRVFVSVDDIVSIVDYPYRKGQALVTMSNGRVVTVEGNAAALVEKIQQAY